MGRQVRGTGGETGEGDRWGDRWVTGDGNRWGERWGDR